ncbi:SIMPL domain-containing protein [Arthrobacter sp. STN4]|uniref:SIMPL domain-containing protein n=1 Tax=Arthrobacter sp. STN4 TaxID=2923276 RepID=UPI002119D5F0|nr:SIMPL domain-containing protein [Arthrobacter sp. STN4]MCQ9165668.1 SIMPL domain-containing protein [Arthrobacter sp. STN4]
MGETTTPDAVTLTGQGTVPAAPDQFHINVGIEAQRGTVRAAYAAATEALNAVQARLLALQVPPGAVSSTALDVRVDTRWQDRAAPVVTGYTVSSTLNVLLRYDDGAEDVIAAVVDSGNDSVRLNGLTPALSDATAAQDAARTLAWADARRAAELYAGMAGRRLGTVRSIAEAGPALPGPKPLFARAAAMSADASMKIEPGQGNVSASVTVTWELL